MKQYLIFLSIVLAFSSCFPDTYESKKIKSPTKNFEIQATVNKKDKNSDSYADVILHLFRDDKKIDKLNTKAGDFSKWTIGWTEYGDTILLQSSDISNGAWLIENNQMKTIEMTDYLNDRAKQLKLMKYK